MMVESWQNFFLDYLQANGVRLKENNGVYELQTTPHLFNLLNISPGYAFTFSKQKATHGVEYVTLGHNLLDRLINLGLQRGKTACLIFPVMDNAPVHLSDKLTSARLLYHQEYLFNYQVAYLGYERVETLHPIQIEAFTESRVEPIQMARGAGVVVPGLVPRENYQPMRLFRQATVLLQEEISQEKVQVEKNLEKGLAKDIHRLEKYYQGLSQEDLQPLRKLFRQLAVANVHCDLVRSEDRFHEYQKRITKLRKEIRKGQTVYDQRVEELKQEHAHRLTELMEQCRVRVEISLVSAALLWVPRWELEIDGQICLLDPLRGQILNPISEEWQHQESFSYTGCS